MRFPWQTNYASTSATWKEDMRQLAAISAKLQPFEITWRDKQSFLESRGYMLRSRYHPTWVPSWELPENAEVDPDSFEDTITPPVRRHLMDATRVVDGRLVYIKRVPTNSNELRIARLLSAEHLVADPRNHCVPILDSFQDATNPNTSYIIMPFLRPFDNPPFETVSDAMDFVGQALAGLAFMHDQGVAHRDCAYRNVMMDANALYPDGHHPVELSRDPTGQFDVNPLPRLKGSIKYYYVDFGLSVHILPGQPRTAVGGHGLDQEPPELSFRIPYNPFKLDIFILGNLLKTLYNEYRHIDFLRPLVDAMTSSQPSQRPDADAAEKLWHELRLGVTPFQESWHLRSRKELWAQTIALSGWNLVGQGARAGKRLFSWIGELQG